MSGYLYGLYRVLIWVVGADGYMYGVQTAPAIGSTTGAFVCKYPKTSTFAFSDPNVVDFTGGDKIVGHAQVGNAPMGPFDLVLQDMNPTLRALIGSTTDNTTTNTFYELVGDNTNLTAPITFGLGVMQRFQDNSVGSGGPDKFVTTILPRCTIRGKRGGAAYQAEASMTYRVTPTFTDKFVNGMTYDSTASTGLNMSFEDAITDSIDLITSYPIHLMLFVADGTASTFTCTYKPVSSVVTVSASPNWFNVNATPTALTSLSTTTALATLTAPGTAGFKDTLIYQVNTNWATP